MIEYPSRRVRRLRLRGPAGADFRRAAVTLEDALRMASLPWADSGRLVVVRRLALGRLPARAAPATLSLLVECAAREVAQGAVSIDSPTAATADAVSFPDRVEALVAAARSVVRTGGAREWYWSAALPGWRSDARGVEGLRLLLDLAWATPAPLLAAARVVEVAVRSEHAEAFARGLSQAECAAWLRAHFEWPVTSVARELPAPEGSGTPAVTPAVSTERAGRDGRGSEGAFCDGEVLDAREVWIACALEIAAKPARAGDRRLPERVVARRARAAMRGPELRPRRESAETGEAERPGSSANRSAAIEPRAEEGGETLAGGGSSSLEEPGRASPAARVSPSSESVSRPRPGVNASREEASLESAPADEAPFAEEQVLEPARSRTVAGGLLFLTRVLRAVGLETFLRENPDAAAEGFPVRLLLDIARRCGVKETDPLLAELAEIPDGDRDPVGGALLEEWRRKVRRACRVDRRIGLNSLVRRPCLFRASRTHLDFFFLLSDIDIRVRRAGLDTDPGWIPWLGRVVHFHYLDRRDDGD